MKMPFYWLFTKKTLIVLAWIIGILSIGLNIYFYIEYTKSQEKLSEIKDKCPEGMECKDLRWVKDYVEVLSGDVQWRDCGEGQNKCAIWEDYNSQTPPVMNIKQCYQQGTRKSGGEWVTGLPTGLHVVLGATVRPCDEVQKPVEAEGFGGDQTEPIDTNTLN